MPSKIRRNYRRALAFLLTAAMVITNLSANLSVAFAAGETERALFMVEGAQLKEAIRLAQEEGEVFRFSSLELKAGRKSIKNKYEKLLGAKEGKVYGLDLEVDDSYAPDGVSLEAYYNAGTGDVVFLFVNESDMVVDFYINIDGYETEAVTVAPNTENVGDGDAAYAEDYQSGTMVDDVKEKPSAAVVGTEPSGEGPAEGEPAETEEAGTQGAIGAEEEETEATEETETTEETEATEETETTEETEETETTEETEATEETQETEETETTEATEETEGAIEEAPEAEGGMPLGISRHGAAVVAVSLDSLDGGEETQEGEAQEEAGAETEEDEEEAQAETEEETEEAQAETEEETREAQAETEEAREEAEEETGEAQAETEEEAEEGSREETEEETRETEEEAEETQEETEGAAGTETGDKATDKPSTGKGEGNGADMDGQLLEDDTEVLGELEGKDYKTVTIRDHANARAFVVAWEDIEGILLENRAGEDAIEYSVEYQVSSPDAATVKGTDSVEKGMDLYFAVQAQEGFEVVAAYANGEEVSEAGDGALASASNWKGYSHVFVVEGVEEDLWIDVEVVQLEEEKPIIPAATYTAETNDAVFTVDVPDGAFAEEVELQVSKIENESKLKEYTDQANEALTSNQVVAGVRAYDISFVSKESGEELEPADTVSVGIRFKGSAVAKDVSDEEVTSLSVVHLPENNEAQVMASVDSVKEAEMEFKADGFSVYVVTSNVEAAAANGENGFATMQEAIDAAENGDTIVLKKTIAENVTITDKTITIDTNGQTWLSKNNYSTTGEGSIITVSNSTLALVGDGKISGVSISGSEYDKLGLGWVTNGNIKYRTITATNSHLVIGEEGAEGPTIEGNGNTFYALYETVNKTRGGAILVQGGSLVMNSGTVQNGCLGGSKSSYGGGIAVVEGDGFVMNGGTIAQNINKKSGTRYGGGVSVEKTDFTMNGGEISGNTVGSYGGGVYVTGTSSAKANVKINGGAISKNIADSRGAGLYIMHSNVTIDKTTFSENSGKGWGGAIFVDWSETAVNDSVFTNNTTYNRGAAIYNGADSKKLTVNGCTITGNSLTKALTSTVGGGICDESPEDLEIGGGTVITDNTIAGGKGGGVYVLKKKAKTISFGDVTITNNEASQGGGVAVDTGASTLTAANKPSIVITDGTKVYGNTARADNAVAGTSAHVSDDFLFFNIDSNIKKTGFDNHVVMVGMDEYTLVNGGDSNVETKNTSRGYYNYQESKLTKEDCVDSKDVYLDPAKKAELYVWLTDENGNGHGEKLTEANGLCTTLKDAYEAAKKDGASGKVYICSTMTLTEEDNPYLADTNVTYMRYKTFQSGHMFSVKGGESVTFNGSHVDGCGIETDSAMVECGLNATLTIAGETVLENANNVDSSGGAVKVHGNSYNGSNHATFYMTGGTIRNNRAKEGGGIYVFGSAMAWQHGTKAVITGGTISGNVATTGNGGGILVENSGTLRMESGKPLIENNIAAFQGGGICIGSDWGGYDASEGYIYSATITGNDCVQAGTNYAGGGGIHIWAGSSLNMKNVYMHSNYGTASVSGQSALYSCPTGKLAIFELDGALITNNKSSVAWTEFPDISFNGHGLYANVSEFALGGGENNWLKGKPSSTTPAPKPYYQNTKESFAISSNVTANTIELAEREATVIITENRSHQPGSAIANNGTLIIGTETKALEVVKKWEAADGGELDEHPDQVMVNLAYRDENGKVVVVDTDTRKDARQILSEANEWRYCWTNLGENTDWTVVEANITGFDPEVPEAVKVSNPLLNQLYQVTLTNKKDEGSNPGSLTVSKKAYKENPDANETFTFVVELTNTGEGLFTYRIKKADGTKGELQWIEDVSSFEVTIKSGEEFTVEGLPEGAGYTVAETEESRENYAVYVDGKLVADGKATGTIKKSDGNNNTQVTIQYSNVETTDISGSKIWDDDNDRDGVRPEKIHITLQSSNGLSYEKEVTADAEGNWTWSFTGLPKRDKDGNLLTYHISEEAVTGYSSVYAENASGELQEFDIKNIHTPGKTSRTVEKVWKDGDNRDHVRPESITVQLYEEVDGNRKASGEAVTLNQGNHWSYTWENLFEKENGKTISYSVEEVDVPGKYEVVIQETGTKFIITNTYNPLTVSKTVEKRWEDNENSDRLRPASVQVRLLADGNQADVKDAVVTLNASNNWKYTWNGLPVNRNGEAISYTVEEINVPAGYSATVAVDGDTITVTNTHAPATVKRTVHKVWNDNNGQDRQRPDSISVELLADGETLETVTLNEANHWSHQWENLPENGKNGNKISYTVKEVNVDGYTVSISESNGVITITNTPDKPSKPNRPGGGGSGGGGGGGGGNTPGGPGEPGEPTRIDEPDVPLANFNEIDPDLIPLVEEEVPLASFLPKTGDSRSVAMWMLVFGGAGIGMLATAIGLKKKRKES